MCVWAVVGVAGACGGGAWCADPAAVACVVSGVRVKPGQWIEIGGDDGRGAARTLRIERQGNGLWVEVVDEAGQPHGIELLYDEGRYVATWMAGW